MQEIKPNIDILISTYNGAKYLREQLDSILNQTYPDWKIIIRDDGSTDNTIEIINEYLQIYPEKFELFTDGAGNVGACQSFAKLIEISDADYIMLSDQDDVWLKDKIDISIKKMIDFESKNGKQIPVLIHTDLKVVDDKLDCISKSFMKYQGLNGNRVNFNQLILQNCITGCTALFNKPLRNIILPIDNSARIHDWWIAVNASIFGKIIYIDKPTILYRQHFSNSIGAKNNTIRTYIDKILNKEKVKKELYLAFKQAKSVLEHNKQMLGDNQKKLLNDISHVEDYGFLQKRIFLVKYKLWKHGLIGNIGLFILI